jgi:hypothetical protein
MSIIAPGTAAGSQEAPKQDWLQEVAAKKIKDDPVDTEFLFRQQGENEEQQAAKQKLFEQHVAPVLDNFTQLNGGKLPQTVMEIEKFRNSKEFKEAVKIVRSKIKNGIVDFTPGPGVE